MNQRHFQPGDPLQDLFVHMRRDPQRCGLRRRCGVAAHDRRQCGSCPQPLDTARPDGVLCDAVYMNFELKTGRYYRPTTNPTLAKKPAEWSENKSRERMPFPSPAAAAG